MQNEENKENKTEKEKKSAWLPILILVLSFASVIDFVVAIFYNDYQLFVPYILHAAVLTAMFLLLMSSLNNCLNDGGRTFSQYLPLFLFLLFENLTLVFEGIQLFWTGTALTVIVIVAVLFIEIVNLKKERNKKQ